MKKVKPAHRTENIKYAVRDILLVADQAKAAGKSLLYLNIGDPVPFGFKTPDFVTEAIVASLRRGETGYAPSAGTPSAVAAIRRDAERRGIRNVQDIFVTTGASEAIELAMTSLLDAGDNILVPCPGYPLYTAILEKLGVEANCYYLDEDNGWQIDVEDVRKRINKRTRAIVVINPNNPTGSVLTRKVAQELVDLAEEHDLVVLSDEIYDRMIFDGEEHISLGALSPNVATVTFNGLSKVYVGPGLRLGWGIVSGPEEKVGDYYRAIQKLTRARLCASTPVMAAVAPALDGDHAHLEEMMTRLKRQRDITYEMLSTIKGISCVKPQAAFYAFPRLDGIKVPDAEWCAGLIREKGVVTVPGSGFGQKPGTSHFRIVFLPHEPQLKQAYANIAEFMK